MFRHWTFRHKIAETDVSAHSDRIQRLQKRMFRHFHDCRNGCFGTMCRNCFWPKHPAPTSSVFLSVCRPFTPVSVPALVVLSVFPLPFSTTVGRAAPGGDGEGRRVSSRLTGAHRSVPCGGGNRGVVAVSVGRTLSMGAPSLCGRAVGLEGSVV